MAKQAFIIALLLLIAIWIAPTSVKGAEAATPRKLVEKFQDQGVVELTVKLPQHVRVPSGGICNPPKYDECDRGCHCVAPLFYPLVPGVCVCQPAAAAASATQETPMVKFEDETAEKLIKLPQRVGIPRGGACSPLYDKCDPGCSCFGGPYIGVCAGNC